MVTSSSPDKAPRRSCVCLLSLAACGRYPCKALSRHACRVSSQPSRTSYACASRSSSSFVQFRCCIIPRTVRICLNTRTTSRGHSLDGPANGGTCQASRSASRCNAVARSGWTATGTGQISLPRHRIFPLRYASGSSRGSTARSVARFIHIAGTSGWNCTGWRSSLPCQQKRRSICGPQRHCSHSQ